MLFLAVRKLLENFVLFLTVKKLLFEQPTTTVLLLLSRVISFLKKIIKVDTEINYNNLIYFIIF